MIIIPARVESSRFPNKVLAKIGDIPMVIKTAKAVEEIDRVVIATDSQEVVDVANEYGFEAVMTSSSCNSGTDRIYEAATKLNLADDEIIINVQADEPFIEKEVVKSLFNLTKEYAKNKEIIATTLYKLVDYTHANNPNVVKVVTTKDNIALYFSRALIPYDRDAKKDKFKAHLGLYGFTYAKLKTFCQMGESTLENLEKLEQLRILDNGYKIALKEVISHSFGIDTKEDLAKALKLHRL
jgi:3-deoxy-manno-octulosonate cytidylyltransferase (CMP-KDO synthetase)